MAEVDTVDGGYLPTDPEFSTRGIVWVIQPDQAAAVSVPSNIAEGQGRLSAGEFRQFLGIARGSNYELQTQLEIARTLGFGNSTLIEEAECLSHEVGKMIYGLLESLKEPASH